MRETPKKMDEIDDMFSQLMVEIDELSQGLTPATPDEDPDSKRSVSGRNESPNEREDHDLDTVVADLRSETIKNTSSDTEKTTSAVEPEPTVAFPPPSNAAESSGKPQLCKPQTRAEEMNVALEEKLKEVEKVYIHELSSSSQLYTASPLQLIVKVLMIDGSSKALMVDERQTVREVLGKLFEKTHCVYSIDWSLSEINPELQTERVFEDHEYLEEHLSTWGHNSQNKIYFVLKPQKYVMFTEPHLFYMWKNKRGHMSSITEKAKKLLIKENFEGPALIVPDLEGMLYLKEDGRKVWRPCYFVLRASGIYVVPKGKTKSSSDLACFSRFEKVNVYTTVNYKDKYRAPTDFCFVLKHPCIQKESHYIKFLCCEDEHTLLLWTNSIRIAKYGTVLYKNYQAALTRASSLQRLRTEAQKATTTNHVEDYPYEPPPDFCPPPPPVQTHV